MRTIFAMGGGGFTMEPDEPALDEYILDLCSAATPKVCFLPTASGDADEQVRRFQATFGDMQCEPSHLSLFRLGSTKIDVREHLLAQDVIYVGGGSMRNMLAIWREHGLDGILVDCWNAGVTLAGLSAGAMCWFEAGITTSSGRPDPALGLGLLPGSLSVHLDGEPEREPVFLDAVARGDIPPGWAADDGVGLLFRDRRLVRVVSSRPGRRAIYASRDSVTELEVEELQSRRRLERRAPFAVMELRRLRTSARPGARRAQGGG